MLPNPPFDSPAYQWRLADAASEADVSRLKELTEHHRAIAVSERSVAESNLTELESLDELEPADRHDHLMANVYGPLLNYEDRMAAAQHAELHLRLLSTRDE